MSSRFRVPGSRFALAVGLCFVLSTPVIAQAPAPAAPTGAQAPGLPPRDTNRATPQAGTARIRGRIIAADTGRPLGRVEVTMGGGTTTRRTMTDAEGRYEFADLPTGAFTVRASKTGYVDLQYGQRRPYEPGTSVKVGDGQTLDRIDIAMPRGGVIVTRVTDDFGEPLGLVTLQVQRYVYQSDGQRRLVNVVSSGVARTDDRGEARIFGLMPGEYVVGASALITATLNRNSGEVGFTPTFYPGVPSPTQAVPVSVAIGQETAVQFAMVAARLVRVSGTAVDSSGRPLAGEQVTLVTQMPLTTGLNRSAAAAADGSFSLDGVAPGDYRVEVRPRLVPPAQAAAALASTPIEFASVPVVVSSADVADIRVVTSPGTVVSGRLVFEGGRPPSSSPTTRYRVTVVPADSSGPFITRPDPARDGTPDADGRFVIAGVSGRVFFGFSYSVTAGTPNVSPLAGWVQKSVTVDGRDITDEPLDLAGRASVSDVVITMTNKSATISGQVGDARGQLVRDYVVIIQPADQKDPVIAGWLTRTVRANSDGRFELRNIRAGRYLATAVESLEDGRQFAPEFREQLRRGAREFTMGEGQTVTLDLRLTPDL